MGTVFLAYTRINPGLLFQEKIEVEYPDQLGSYREPITKVDEDNSGKIRVETANRVYIQEGFMKLSGEDNDDRK